MSCEACLSWSRKTTTALLCLPGPGAEWEMQWSSASHSWSSKSTCREFDLHQSQAVDVNTIPSVLHVSSFLSDCVHWRDEVLDGEKCLEYTLIWARNSTRFQMERTFVLQDIYNLLYTAMVSKTLLSLQFPWGKLRPLIPGLPAGILHRF